MIKALRREVAELRHAVKASQRSKALERDHAALHPRDRRPVATFERAELQRILTSRPDGRGGTLARLRHLVRSDAAVFAVFRRAAEQPEVRIEKRPQLHSKQGRMPRVGAWMKEAGP
jgi:hypothetical protein